MHRCTSRSATSRTGCRRSSCRGRRRRRCASCTPVAAVPARRCPTRCRRSIAFSSDTLDDTIERPQQLYLTGDQIYADDVSDTLLPMLTQLGRELLGPDEVLPVDDKKVPVTLINFPAARRSKLMRLEAKFSTGSAANHLLSFGEFAAMYLAVWSSRAWRAMAKPEDIFIGAGPNAAVSELLTGVGALLEVRGEEEYGRGNGGSVQAEMAGGAPAWHREGTRGHRAFPRPCAARRPRAREHTHLHDVRRSRDHGRLEHQQEMDLTAFTAIRGRQRTNMTTASE